MFIEQRKKKNYRTFIYSAIIVFLCILIVVSAWPANETDEPPVQEQPDDRLPAEQPQDDNITDEPPVQEQPDDRPPAEQPQDDRTVLSEISSEENPDITQPKAAYYLVRKDDDLIKVFFFDENGSCIELETTDIVYDVLSTEDQKLFEKGFAVSSQEELAGLLQDFES